MCGIIGIFNHPQACKKARKTLSLLRSRGRDGLGLSNFDKVVHAKTISKLARLSGKNVIGHTLHAVVSKVPQPMKSKTKNKDDTNGGVLAVNGEVYNWQELAKKYHFSVRNDAEMLLQFIDKFGLEQSDKLNELDGVYAFAYWKKTKVNDKNSETVTLIRDLLGEKPLWYAHENNSFAFASEKKVLEKLGYTYIQELHPRQILIYNVAKNSLQFTQRPFFTCQQEHKDDYNTIFKKTAQLLAKAIDKRIPKQKFGLLFSGGLDSTYLAYYLKQKKVKFTCYTTVLEVKETEDILKNKEKINAKETIKKKEAITPTQPQDLVYALKAAKYIGLKLKVKKILFSKIPAYLKKVVPLIEDNNVTKAGVALTFYAACEMAKKDGCKVIFSGLGSEEIFAGYERHKLSLDLNQECVSGLRKLFERDLYRDDVVTMHHGLELRLPYLDKELVEYALKIPFKYKIKEGQSKYILRSLAEEQGLLHELAFRKKVAAQYGSRIDSAIEKYTKQNHLPIKSAYIYKFYPQQNLRLGVLFSSGKDSTYAAYVMQRQNYQLSCLITLKSKNPDSYMFQTAGTEMVELQAKAMKLPLITQSTLGEKEAELRDLKSALQMAKTKYHIDGIVTGALASTYQRERIELTCEELGLKIFSPLWHKPQEQEMYELIQHGFKFILTAVAADGLDKTWLNRIITLGDLEKLKAISKKNGLNVAGEGGEFESVVLDGPLFKQKIVIDSQETKEEGKNTAHLLIKKAHLEKK
ncbi:diphthine--ammonia ligase [Candidatus Woesearchaeota archaeon]|nr:diphthine--ammonia ligase [Candidatus Woesearchaeota archaeon]